MVVKGKYYTTEDMLQKTIDDLEEQRDDLMDELEVLKEQYKTLTNELEVSDQCYRDLYHDFFAVASKHFGI